MQATQEVNAGTLIGYEVQIDKGDIIGIAKDIVVNTTSGGIDYVIIRN